MGLEAGESLCVGTARGGGWNKTRGMTGQEAEPKRHMLQMPSLTCVLGNV